MTEDTLLKLAIAAAKNAYAPYSKFCVGAAILLNNNQVIQGCNVENASYGLTNCAERTALFAVYAAGYTKENITKIAVVASSKIVASPCGACRQVLVELTKKNCPIILSNFTLSQKKYTTPQELLPFSFYLSERICSNNLK